MSKNIVTCSAGADTVELLTNSWRPARFKDGLPYDEQDRLCTLSERDLRSNAFLQRSEWETLDAAIIPRAEQRMNILSDLTSAGLITQGSPAEWYSTWRVASEVVEADVSMDFETQVREDRPDMKTYGVPVPIMSASFSIGRRELMTARANGTPLDTSAAEASGVAVGEKVEEIIIDGNTSIVLQGNSIPGLQTLAARYQGSAEGDFGILSNIYPTFLDLIAQMGALRYHGEFNVYIANNQYNEMLEVYDSTGETALERVLRLPKISAVKVNDLVDDGEFLAVQMSPDVIDYREALSLETRRWEHPSGARMFYLVLLMGAPRLKTDYEGTAGIAHYTGC